MSRRPTCTTVACWLDDTVEFFNLVLGTKLTGEEKHDPVAFLRTL
jgi:hypothetical protein